MHLRHDLAEVHLELRQAAVAVVVGVDAQLRGGPLGLLDDRPGAGLGLDRDLLLLDQLDRAGACRVEDVLGLPVRVLQDGVGLGQDLVRVRELLGQRLAVDLTVTGYEPGRLLGLESTASGLGVAAYLELAPDGGGTRVRFGMTISAKSPLMTPLEGMVAGAAERDLADSLERLRSHFATEG